MKLWCVHHALNMHALKEAKQTLDNLRACLQFIGHPLTHASVTNFKPILKAIAVAFCTCSTVQTQHDVYRNVYERAPGLIHPLSSLLGQGYEWVVYDEYYLRGRKQYHEMVTAVNPEWLLVYNHIQT